jgi:hypothetical protein
VDLSQLNPNVHTMNEVSQALRALVKAAEEIAVQVETPLDLLCRIDEIESGAGVVDAKYIVQEAHAGLSAEQSLGLLTTGLLKNTVTAGVGVLTTALVGSDYSAPGHTHPLAEITDEGKLAAVDTADFLTPFFASATPVAIV